MGEIHIEPLQKQNGNWRNKSSTTDELEEDIDVENLKQDLRMMKMKLVMNDDECREALLKFNHYQETTEELFSQQENSELEKEINIHESKYPKFCVNDELESSSEDINNEFSEHVNTREELSHALFEVRASEEHVLRLEEELESANDAKFEYMEKAELAESALDMEKLRNEQLLRKISELNETVMHLKIVNNQAEKGKGVAELMQGESEDRPEEIEHVTKQLETINNLESELLEKSQFIELLQSELSTAKGLHECAEKLAFDAICELDIVKAGLELKEEKNADHAGYISKLETELEGLKVELMEANEERNIFARNVEDMKEELEETRRGTSEARAKETEMEIEIALLRSELHKGRSKLAAAAAAEERAKIEKQAVKAALYQMAAEALEAKKENLQLKETIATYEDSKKDIDLNESENVLNMDPRMESDSEGNKLVDLDVTISREEYELLVKNAEQARHVKNLQHEYKVESETLKKELEIAFAKAAEFRTRAEQAISRAEAAEKVKVTLEERIKRWKEQRAKKKAALATLHEETIAIEDSSLRYKNAQKVYQPLGKILNMKF